MSAEVLIFLHMEDEYPGYIADYLTCKSIPYRIIRCYQADPIPVLDESVLGLVFMGGVMSVNDNLPWLLAELRLIKEAIAKNIPLLGHCLGGQLISKALGAEITKNSVSEVGWHMCQRTECSASSAWLNGLPNSFIMFHWHNETFALPPQAKHLFSSQYCENQAYSYGHNVFAMQGHVEMTVPLATYWIEHWQDQLRTSSPSQQSYDEIKVDLQKNITALNTVADSIYSCWVATLAKQ